MSFVITVLKIYLYICGWMVSIYASAFVWTMFMFGYLAGSFGLTVSSSSRKCSVDTSAGEHSLTHTVVVRIYIHETVKICGDSLSICGETLWLSNNNLVKIDYCFTKPFLFSSSVFSVFYFSFCFDSRRRFTLFIMPILFVKRERERRNSMKTKQSII